MLRYLSLLLILITVSGCSGIYNSSLYTTLFRKPQVVPAIDAAEVSRTILIFSEKLRYTQKLDLDDSVIYYSASGMNRIRLDYSSMDSLPMCDARAMLVDVVEDFVARINENQTVHHYLSKRPFTAADLEIYIHFPSFFNKYVDLQMVGLISLRGGIANYIAANAFDCDTSCWQRRSEYYYQSRNFVNFKRQGEALYKPIEIDPSKRSAFEEERYFSSQVRAGRG